VELEVEVDIRLQFWVLPDGTVGDVIPLVRGDLELERAAIEYLKNWRFTPVDPDQPPVWGIMPITYTLR
jgi:TonB family protein